MSIADQAFRDAFKPLHVPANYEADDSEQNKVVYALAQIGEGTPLDVAKELLKADQSVDVGCFTIIASSVLNNLFEKGLIKGTTRNGDIHYDLSKIIESNDGAVNPDLLAPGLD